MERGAGQATDHGVAKSHTQLCDFHFFHFYGPLIIIYRTQEKPGLPTQAVLSDSKESACNAGDLGLIPGLGRCPGEEKGTPLQ